MREVCCKLAAWTSSAEEGALFGPVDTGNFFILTQCISYRSTGATCIAHRGQNQVSLALVFQPSRGLLRGEGV